MRVPSEAKLESKSYKYLERVSTKSKLSDIVEATYNHIVLLWVMAKISDKMLAEVIEDFEYNNLVELSRNYLKNKIDNYLVFRVSGQIIKQQVINNESVDAQRKKVCNNTDGAVSAFRLNDAITLKHIQFDHQRQQVLLHPFNADYRVQVLDSIQDEDISLIGTMVMQLRL